MRLVDALREVMEREGLTEAMAAQLAHKATEGDLRALGMVIDMLRENGEFPSFMRVELAPDVADLAE